MSLHTPFGKLSTVHFGKLLKIRRLSLDRFVQQVRGTFVKAPSKPLVPGAFLELPSKHSAGMESSDHWTHCPVRALHETSAAGAFVDVVVVDAQPAW